MNKDKLLIALAFFIVISCTIVAIEDKKRYNKIDIACKKQCYQEGYGFINSENMCICDTRFKPKYNYEH